MINGICKTNLDDYRRVEWPTRFITVPRKGDYIRSLDHKNELKVVRIVHCDNEKGSRAVYKEPYIIIELHK